MKFENSKKQGNAGIGIAICYFTSLGHTVSVPLTDSQSYDLVVDVDGILNKIQVKTCTHRTETGNYQVGIRSSGGNKTRTKVKEFDPKEVDYLFIALDNGDMYLIPSNRVSTKNTVTICDKYKEFKILV